ncbi:hypothetical protein V6N12_023835 [Hibiscus sabdariffa]|uniref:Uncharacterized protein n=1 Tax=Hibiscus sabdariffa TaxID=183260 RepID=A0ABR2FZQ0_9ROSI
MILKLPELSLATTISAFNSAPVFYKSFRLALESQVGNSWAKRRLLPTCLVVRVAVGLFMARELLINLEKLPNMDALNQV